MLKLPDNNIDAYESVQDTLSAATTVCISILNEERDKEFPDQAIINKYEQLLKKIFTDEREPSSNNPQRRQEISDEYLKFVRSYRGL